MKAAASSGSLRTPLSKSARGHPSSPSVSPGTAASRQPLSAVKKGDSTGASRSGRRVLVVEAGEWKPLPVVYQSVRYHVSAGAL
jgi:hypothetical protein